MLRVEFHFGLFSVPNGETRMRKFIKASVYMAATFDKSLAYKSVNDLRSSEVVDPRTPRIFVYQRVYKRIIF